MQGRRRQPRTTPDIAGEAESLVRALRGVTRARVHASDSGIESIHVTASDDAAATHMAARVRSALLAGLAAPVTPTCIHVAVAPVAVAPAVGAGVSAAARAAPDATPGIAPDPCDEPPAPRDRLRLLHTGNARPDPAPQENRVSLEEPTEPEPPLTARPRLVAVDAERTGDGRVVCRVSIAYGTRVHRAEAAAVDLPGSAAQAAAQAAVRALIDAGLTGIELNGLREVEIAGRDYVLVALRRNEPYTRTRSGSAPIIGSAERSAAQATVAAANELA